MARPTKQGIDYFPLDCNFDDKIEMYLLEKGANGLAVLVTIWQMVYSNNGYYTQNGKDLKLLIKRRINVDINEVADCINVCLERNIFDSGMYDKYHILTSKAIQKRYFDAAKKKKSVNINPKYVLIDVSDCGNLVNVPVNPEDVGENATNVKENVKENVDIKNKWNAFAEKNNLSKIISLTKQRNKHIKNRLKEPMFDLDAIFPKIENSDFLLGRVEKGGWKVNFDFIIKNSDNYVKILEGGYDNNKYKPIPEY